MVNREQIVNEHLQGELRVCSLEPTTGESAQAAMLFEGAKYNLDALAA